MRYLVPLALVLHLGACVAVTPNPRAAPPATAAEPVAEPAPVYVCVPCQRDTHEQLQGTLWTQTSAEYAVLARTTYKAAAAALDEALADPAWTAAVEQSGDPSALPPAVILDLDETVLDNSPFQAEMALRRTVYSSALWQQWVALRAAELVPGAKAFLDHARERGVAVFFVTNRSKEEEADTVDNLRALGVETGEERVLAKGEREGWTSDKTTRRRHLAAEYRILLLLGDDLNDFLPAKLPPAERREAALARDAWWGERWFLLPNPAYGSWEGALNEFDRDLSDRDVLLRKFGRLRGFFR